MTQRTTISDLLSDLLPTYSISSNPQTVRPENYLVLKYGYRSQSSTNSLASFAYWNVLVYVSADSIIPIDHYVDNVKTLLKSRSYEITNVEIGDYYDPILQRFKVEIEFRIPQGGIN